MTNTGQSTQKPKAISVVIPTYNGRKLLEKHLPAVLESMRSGDELVIVDDASSDDTVEWLCEKFDLMSNAAVADHDLQIPSGYWPELSDSSVKVFTGSITRKNAKISIQLIVLTENQRFAAAANSGVGLASQPYIFLLNNDVSPVPDVLKHLLEHFSDERVFAVGCLELEGEPSAVPLKKSGKNRLWFSQGLYQHSGVSESELTRGETAWVSGGSGMFDRKKWLSLGGFDPRFYPAYWEDVDLSLRARKMGWQILFEPEAVVYHQHETTNTTEFGARNIQVTSWRHADVFTWIHATPVQRLLYLLWHPVWLWRRSQA